MFVAVIIVIIITIIVITHWLTYFIPSSYVL